MHCTCACRLDRLGKPGAWGPEKKRSLFKDGFLKISGFEKVVKILAGGKIFPACQILKERCVEMNAGSCPGTLAGNAQDCEQWQSTNGHEFAFPSWTRCDLAGREVKIL